MTMTQFVDYRGKGFWAYDVALGVYLKHLIDAAEQRKPEADAEWLEEAVAWWRVAAVISDYGLTIESSWSESQIDVLLDLLDRACTRLAEHEEIPASEIVSWPLLDDLRIHPRGAIVVRTAPVVELGLAIIALINGTLPESPAGTVWFYGVLEGRTTIRGKSL